MSREPVGMRFTFVCLRFLRCEDHNVPIELVYRVIGLLLSGFSSLLKASAAVNGSVIGRLESYSCLTATVGANSGEILTGRFAGILLCLTACLAALRLVQKAFFRVKSLFAGSENKFISTFLAYKGFVLVYLLVSNCVIFVHCKIPRLNDK